MQAVGIKTALACILFGFSSLGPGGHFQADEGVSLRRDAGGHFAAEFPYIINELLKYSYLKHYFNCFDRLILRSDSPLRSIRMAE